MEPVGLYRSPTGHEPLEWAEIGGWPMLSPHTKPGALPFSRSLREGGAFEESVVDPNPGTYFLKDFYLFSRRHTFLVSSGRFGKKPVLGEGATGVAIWLIYFFGIRSVERLGHIVSFIDERPAIILDSVCVRCSWPKTHQNDAFPISQTEIHSALEIHSCR